MASGSGDVGISHEELTALLMEVKQAQDDPQRLRVSDSERLRTGATSTLPPLPDNLPDTQHPP
ncbi:hypothetical protein JOF56_003231 [Kibdelosporangium banguiense]|uniref:Uncharacterized protein n=1 Tax=Kibdelosporangium banguiense TaxID=1365924 RepID=A0ABS4TEK1_9PSEU|nr:hypothetical protein [Kibdelosporangium banguiense]